MAFSITALDTGVTGSRTGSTVTFTGVDVGSGGLAVCAIGWERDQLDSATINGVTATITPDTPGAGNARSAVISASTTGASVTVQLNLDAGTGLGYTLSSFTIADGEVDDSGATDGAPFITTPSVDISTTSGGALVASSFNSAGSNTATWTGATENSTAAPAGRSYSDALNSSTSTDATFTVSCAWASASNVSMSAASFKPSAAGGITGTGAINNTVQTLSGTGTVTKTGTGAINSTVQTLSGTGTIGRSGSGAITNTVQTLSGTGTVGGAIVGSGAIDNTVPTLAGSGIIARTGSGAVGIPVQLLSGTGVVPQVVTGSGGVTMPMQLLHGTGPGIGYETKGAVWPHDEERERKAIEATREAEDQLRNLLETLYDGKPTKKEQKAAKAQIDVVQKELSQIPTTDIPATDAGEWVQSVNKLKQDLEKLSEADRIRREKVAEAIKAAELIQAKIEDEQEAMQVLSMVL